MATAESVKAKIQGLINKVNNTTHGTETTLTAVVDRLLEGYGGSGLAINGAVRQYKTQTGLRVEAGDFVQLIRAWGSGKVIDGAAEALASVAIDEARVLIAYIDPSDKKGRAVVLSVDGTAVTAGTPYVFSEHNISSVAATALSAGRVCIVYNDPDGTVTQKNARYSVLEVTGTTITKVASATFGDYAVRDISVAALSENSIAVAYYEIISVVSLEGTTTTRPGYVQVFTNVLEGGAGVERMIASDNVRNPKIVALDANRAAVVYEKYDWDTSTAQAGAAIIVRLNADGSLSPGFEQVYNNLPVYYTAAVALTKNRVLVVYQDGEDPNKATARMLTVTGIYFDRVCSAYALDSNSASHITVTALTHDTALVVTNVYTSRFEARAMLVSTDEYSVTKVGETTFLTNTGAAAVTNGALVAFSASNLLFVSCVGTNTGLAYRTHYHGLVVDGTTVKATASDYAGATQVRRAKNTLQVGGVAKTSGGSGATVEVYVPN